MNNNNKKFLVKNVALWSKANILKNNVDSFSNFLIDTRKYKADSAFVALKGNVDAHSFLAQAYDKGVRVFFIDNSISKIFFKEIMLLKDISLLQVPDTLKALQLIASKWRTLLQGKVVAISGSNGKTSTKNFSYQILKTYKKTYKSPLSFNNHLGVPLSLLEANQDDEVIILEMGMNHKEELKLLTTIAKPDISLITQVSQAHIGHFNSLNEVAEAKQELYQFSPSKSTGIFNEDNIFTQKMKTKYLKDSNRLCFSFGSEKILKNKSNLQKCVITELTSESLSGLSFTLSYFDKNKEQHKNCVSLSLLGSHNINNIAAAVAISLALKMPWSKIIKALNNLQQSWGRMQLLYTNNGASVIFDAYNANPSSFKSALDSLEKFSCTGKKIALIGAMGELGKWSDKEHSDLSLRISSIFDSVGFIGDKKSFVSGLQKNKFKGSFVHSKSVDDKEFQNFLETLASSIKKEDIVFIKASRFYKLEKILQKLKIKN
ncbi:MAG: UDP-N-acetylmuramoyl-tripeptide--D-alanyl-D-alanine ligase [Bdellovibrionales bacterium]|nr:UDP-N-acetylmuramoyl-tripeptide--D-alanyl-D-alanine ligase [Bdellovibrionales bacterium]